MRVAYALIVVCVLATLFYWYGGEPASDFVNGYLVYSGNRFLEGFLWTPATALLIHANWIHLIGNMLFLYAFSTALKNEVSDGYVLASFFTGGIMAFLLGSFFYGISTNMVGASAAVFTLGAIAMLVKPLKISWAFLFMPVGLIALLYFLFNIFAVYYSIGGNVGYICHIIGFLVGVPFGIALSKGKWLRNLTITLLLLALYIAITYLIKPILISYLT